MQGSIRERSAGVWQIRVSLGRDQTTGRYRYASATVRGGRRDAQRAAAKLFSKASEGKLVTTADTLDELFARWLAHLESLDRAPKTLVEHRRMATEISSRLGKVKLRDLRGTDIDALYDHLRRKGLSTSTVRRYHAVLSAALNRAVRWGLLERSPLLHATPPPLGTVEASCPLPAEVNQLIDMAEQHDPLLASFLLLAATTGCRRGELCGLRWSDIDLDGAQLIIRRAISDVPGRLEVRSTKTGRIRRLSLDTLSVGALRAQLDRARASAAQVGGSLEDEAYVWSQAVDHSEPWRPSRVSASFVRIRGEAGLPSVQLHHLRHFAASVMLAGGVDVRTAAGRLGHAQPAITLKTYAHVMEAADRNAADIVGRVLEKT
ncbi:MAG: tyrosine-type recombinase/integrase [Acidimicrobiales bacterium]